MCIPTDDSKRMKQKSSLTTTQGGFHDSRKCDEECDEGRSTTADGPV
jgi:hypothetical protein